VCGSPCTYMREGGGVSVALNSIAGSARGACAAAGVNAAQHAHSAGAARIRSACVVPRRNARGRESRGTRVRDGVARFMRERASPVLFVMARRHAC